MRKILSYILYSLYYVKIYKEKRKTNRVLAIYGHNTEGESFRSLIVWLLNNGYHFINITELIDYLNGIELKHKKNVWLSFDDGWKSNYTDVFPVLKEFNIPATIYISTKAIEDGYFWFDKARQNRNAPYYKEIKELWEMPNKDRERIISKLPEFIGDRRTMTPGNLKELVDSRLVTLGNHTHDHVMSDKCSTSELEEQIAICNDKLKEWTDVDCNLSYSFPNGNKDEVSIKILKEKGFLTAATTQMGSILSNTDRFLLPRNEFKDHACLAENILQIYGIWTPFWNMLKKIFGIKNNSK